MNGVNKKTYLSLLSVVFTLGAIASWVIEQYYVTGSVAPLLTLKGWWHIWQFVASGGTLAGVVHWVFERWLWKLGIFQETLVRFPYLEGTWVGVIKPHTSAMRPGPPGRTIVPDESIPPWARAKGVLPIHVLIRHELDNLIYTAYHPNSTNRTLAKELVRDSRDESTLLYVVYHNVPKDERLRNAGSHEGCCELTLEKYSSGKVATNKWELRGKYWTDKRRQKGDDDDRGTWGRLSIKWKSRDLQAPPSEYQEAVYDI